MSAQMLAAFMFSGILLWCYVDIQLFKFLYLLYALLKKHLFYYLYICVWVCEHVCVFPWKPWKQNPWSCNYTWAVRCLGQVLGTKLRSREEQQASLMLSHLSTSTLKFLIYLFFLFEKVPSYCRKVSGGKHMGEYVPRTKFFPLQVASDEEPFYLFHKKDGMSLKIYYTVRYYE